MAPACIRASCHHCPGAAILQACDLTPEQCTLDPGVTMDYSRHCELWLSRPPGLPTRHSSDGGLFSLFACCLPLAFPPQQCWSGGCAHVAAGNLCVPIASVLLLSCTRAPSNAYVKCKAPRAGHVGNPCTGCPLDLELSVDCCA